MRSIGTTIVTAITLAFIYSLWRGGGTIGWGITFSSLFILSFGWVALRKIFGSSDRIEHDKAILYVPAPVDGLAMGVLAPLLGGGLLYFVLQSTRPTTADFAHAMIVVFLIAVVPALFNIYSTIRDRNDFIKLTADFIQYRNDTSEITLTVRNLYQVKVIDEGIEILFNNNTVHVIPYKDMGFDKDLAKSVEEDAINLIPKDNQPAAMPGDIPAKPVELRKVVERAPEPQAGDATAMPTVKKGSNVSNVIGAILGLLFIPAVVLFVIYFEKFLPSPAEAGQSILDDIVFRASFQKNGFIFLGCVIFFGLTSYAISALRKRKLRRSLSLPSHSTL